MTDLIERLTRARYNTSHAYDSDLLRDAADEIEDLTANPRDEYHTMRELYDYRMAWHAAAVNAWQAIHDLYDAESFYSQHTPVTVKSWYHSDGELCFGGGWFIVVSSTPQGQISNHYKAEHWDLFKVPETDTPPAYDGHTPQVALERLLQVAAH